MNEKIKPLINRRVDKSNLSISVWENSYGISITLGSWYVDKKNQEKKFVNINTFPDKARAFAEQILAVCDELSAMVEENKRQTAKQIQRNEEPLPGFEEDEDNSEIPF